MVAAPPKLRNMKGLKVTTPPARTPVSVAEMKTWLQLDTGFTDDDALITSLIEAAVESGQNYTHRSFITQTITARLDRIPFSADRELWWDGVVQAAESILYGREAYINLPYGSVQSVTSFTTIDQDNNSAVFSSDNYHVDTYNDRIVLNDGATWPTDLRSNDAVIIVYVAGYGDAEDVPASIKNAIKMHVARMYDQRLVCDLPAECKALYDNEKRIDRLFSYG